MIRDFLLDIRKTFIFHAVASHFINGSIPMAVFFLLLTLFNSDRYFGHTAIYLIYVASSIVPFSIISGIRDWRIKFKGGRAPIFYHKIKLSIILALLCVSVISIRLVWPSPFAANDIVAWLYCGCIFMMLPVVFLLGHYGSKLAHVRRQKSTDRADQWISNDR
jgi:uncharacterized membrane protein